MFTPPHTGEILKEDVLPDLGLTVTEAAKQHAVTRVTFSRIINGKSGISLDMALRLAAWLGTSADSLLNMQVAYDLWQAEQQPRPMTAAARITLVFSHAFFCHSRSGESRSERVSPGGRFFRESIGIEAD